MGRHMGLYMGQKAIWKLDERPCVFANERGFPLRIFRHAATENDGATARHRPRVGSLSHLIMPDRYLVGVKGSLGSGDEE